MLIKSRSPWLKIDMGGDYHTCQAGVDRDPPGVKNVVETACKHVAPDGIRWLSKH